MIIVRLIYYSRNRVEADPRWHRERSGAGAPEAIHDILIELVANNRRDDITGALIHDDHWFAQALEGRETIVSATFERILRDERHCDVRLISMQVAAERRFAAWWMACVARSAGNADLFRHHCEGEGFDPQRMRAERLGDLIEAAAAGTPCQTACPDGNASAA